MPALLAACVVAALVFERPLRLRIGDWAKTEGFQVYDRGGRMRDHLLAMPGRLLRSVDVPHLHLDVEFEHMQRIWAKRAEALAKGLLETDAGDMVPASLSVGDRRMKVDLRLKGDWTDHLVGEKWSFRIEVDGDDHVFGMRRFSVQSPQTRGYQGEPLFFELLRSLGVLAPRYRFVTVSLNGTSMGMMALEEHFGRELLERSERRDGVIVRFDEELVFHGVDDYRVAPISIFQPGRAAKSPSLAAQRDAAVGLLHGFVRGELSASQVFRVDQLAALVAAAELFGSHHCLRWHNLRFYYDGLRGRLEPIAFDANLHERQPFTTSVSADEPIVRAMLDDPVVHRAYRAALEGLCRSMLDERFVAALRERERELVEVLRSDYRLLGSIQLEPFVENARRRLADRDFAPTTHVRKMRPATRERSLHVRGWLQRDGGDGPVLELANATDRRIEVTGLTWRSTTNGDERPCRLRGRELPLVLRPQAAHGPPDVLRVACEPLAAGEDGAFELEITSRRGDGEVRTTTALASIAAAQVQPVPSSTTAEQLARHAFLSLDADGVTLRAAPGDWLVEGIVVVPHGGALVVPAGTRLRFSRQGALVAHGPLQLLGDPGRIVELCGEGEAGWLGVAVLDPGRAVTWRHAVVRRTTGVVTGQWQLTAGVCFVGAHVTLRDVSLVGSTAEDALNVVGGTFAFEELHIAETRSDAFDADFADGSLRGGAFTSIGGDGVDVSGSVVEVQGVRFTDVRDKALSVGEGSAMRARGVRIVRAGTGAASKDASSLELTDSSIVDAAHFGMAAYVKKPEFGSASIRAARVRTPRGATRAIVQSGSELFDDGVPVAAIDLDVDALYETVMRKDAGR